MGKVKKKKSSFCSSSLSSNYEVSNFQDDVIQHLKLFKESKGLVIGFNAVLREIAKESLCVVIYFPKKGTSAMYHALNLMCKGKDTLFLQVKGISSIFFCSNIPTSTTYGIKESVANQPGFSQFLHKMNIARSTWKIKRKLAIENEEICVVSQTSYEDVKSTNSCKNIDDKTSKKSEAICDIHPKHDILKQNCTGKKGMLHFQEVNFPNYKTKFNQISFFIK